MRSVSSEDSVVLLSYFLRSESAHARFWPRLRAAFEVEHLPAASFGCAGADRGDGSRGLFRLRKRSEGDYEELERRRAEKEEEEEEEEGAEAASDLNEEKRKGGEQEEEDGKK